MFQFLWNFFSKWMLGRLWSIIYANSIGTNTYYSDKDVFLLYKRKPRMKKNLHGLALLLLIIILITACKKQDDADAFIGTYSVSTTLTSTWAGMSHTNALSGTMDITKISANRVHTTGWISTFGEIVGNTIYFESYDYSEPEFTVTCVFGPGALNGNILTFNCTESGQIQSFGNWYNYYSTSQHTCIKQPQ